MRLAWTIAGSDPSGAAGSQADQRVFSALGVHVCSVITSVTAQNFAGFQASMPLAGSDLQAQLRSLSDARMPQPVAIKIGMLGSADAVSIVAACLTQQTAFVILDPVLSASAGGVLADAKAISQMVAELLPRVDLLTPNIPEAEQLTGRSIRSFEDVPAAAAALREMGVRNVLIKGGHLSGLWVHDYFSGDGQAYWLSSQRQAASVRGTGCALASAIAAYITLGRSMEDSLVQARAYVSRGIRTALPTEVGPSLLGWMDSMLSTADMPWRTQSLDEARERLTFPSCGPEPIGFYPVVDRVSWVRRMAEAGATTIQLRIKDLSGQALLRELGAAVALSRQLGFRLFINDYWALALELGAYGVHLGQEDLPNANVAALAAGGIRLGVSTHCYSEACVAHALRPSYLALGPIFPTTCKSLRFGPHGLERIVEWRRLFPYPLVAIGGLTVDHAEPAMRLGADGVAVISDVVNAPDPDARARLWRSRCKLGNP